MKNFLKHLLPSKEAIFNQEAIMEELPIIAKHLYPKEVMEIHHEFETAADNAYGEVQFTIDGERGVEIYKHSITSVIDKVKF